MSVDTASFMMALETLRGADAALDFITRVTPSFERPEHLRPLAEFFVNAERGPVFACTSVPPQHGKTETISHLLVRYMLRFPAKRNAYVSYAIDFSQDVGRKMLEIARRAGLQLTIAKQNQWVTPQGGGLIITGIGGQVTGKPVDGIFVIDDPHKDRFESNSATIRQTAVDYVTITAAGRLHPCTSMLANGTRWHVSDVIGTLKEREQRDPIGWQFINLPALDDTGKALWPKHRPAEFLNRQRRILGEYDFSAEYLGQPVPDGGEVFHEPERYDMSELRSAEYWSNRRILIACDPAITAKTSADYSAIVVGTMQPDPHGGQFHSIDVLDYRSMQVETPALVRELLALQRAWKCPIAVEAVGAFKAVPQALRQIDRSLWVMEIQPQGDKLVRCRPTAAAWNDARVRVPLPGSTSWVDKFVREVRQFTGIGDKHDDAVDALVHCWDSLNGMVSKGSRIDKARRIAAAMPFG